MSESDNGATSGEQANADALAAENERAVIDTTPSGDTTLADERPSSVTTDPMPGEPELPGAQLGTVSRSRSPQLLAGVGLVALVLFVIRRLKARHAAPPTPSERLTESARAVRAASVAAGGRAVDKLSENAGPTAERAVELAKRGAATGAETAQRAATAAKPVVAAAATVAAREG